MFTNMKLIVHFFFLILQINISLCKNYSHYTVFRAIPVEEEDVDYFKNLSQHYKVDYWREPGGINKPVDFMIGPNQSSQFLREAQNRRLYVTTIIDDVQRAFDMQTVKTYIRRRMETFDWNSFYRYKDIYNWLLDLKKTYPKEVKLLTMGRTEENRELIAVRVALNESNIRSTVIIEGGIHAREWIATAVVTYILNQIVTSGKSKNNELIKIANTYEWIFVPMLNPDGYEYSHTEDRLWRKNRRGGYGVDINRNFDSKFGSVGVSHEKRDDIYCGPKAFSEKESSAMADLVDTKKETLEYYIGFHSYGQYIIIPYAHSKRHFDNYDEVMKICENTADRIQRKFGTKYTSGTAYDTVGYRTSGVSGCWVKKKYRVPYVAIFELRDEGKYGFALPPQQIMPTCLETMDGVLTLLIPRTKKQIPMKQEVISVISDGQEKKFLNSIVIVFNVFLFIIVRFD